MKYLSFEINHYRAIENASVKISNSLIPIIGINESGKTTILHAILAFDKSKDKYNNGAHLVHKNRYEITSKEAQIIANVVIESPEEVDEVAIALGLEVVSSLYQRLKEYQKENIPIQIVRTFPSKKYSILNEDLKKDTSSKGEKLALELFNRLPFILYFDDFSDRVPATVDFNINLVDKKTIPKSQNIEWHQILEEVFIRSTGTTLQDFVKTRDAADQTAIINDIQDNLQAQVVEDWKNLKVKYGTEIGEEGENLQIRLEWNLSDAEDAISFSFRVQDRSTGKGREFGVTERSKGFQWFFNFIMKLKYNPKYKSDLKGAIYLLDEPGSYLHNSAQTELLKKLKEISETNTILYCTHSEYLLDPELINISNIRIAQKEKGNIQILPLGSAGKTSYEGAFAPLYKALHMKGGFFDKDVKYPVITEGITDFYLFKLVEKYKPGFFPQEISFIPGAGATCLRDLISNAIAFSDNYIVFLDSDKEGRSAYDTYTKHFGLEESKHFFKYQIPSKTVDVQLEDFISDTDKVRLSDLTKVEDTKASLSVLYYLDEVVKRDFVEGLDRVTLDNLSIVKGKMDGLISKSE